MVIKKFQAQTETEAILMAKEEMGSNAIVLNIKTLKPRGIKKLFQKGSVEITAALEDKYTTNDIPVQAINMAAIAHNIEEEKTTSAIEEKLNNLQYILESSAKLKNTEEETEKDKDEKKISESDKFISIIYDKLLENEVDEKFINQIIREVEASIKKETNLDSILMGIYQKIILKLGQPKIIKLDEDKMKIVFFIGPTGVGKTTTIAKLASEFRLNKKIKVGFITADTYRIAAVEQLRIYANILDVPMQVVYSVGELDNAIELYRGYDLVLIDTAGRSHKNQEQYEELCHLIKDFNYDEKKMSVDTYLVLSAATKYKDLVRITETYNDICDYSLLFTKLDETLCLGNILNIKLNTGASLSYATSGQVVPDDISAIDAQKIAKNLLGGNEA